MNAQRIDSDHRKFDLGGALEYALNKLTYELSPDYTYHSLWHSAYEVVNQALYLAVAEQVSEDHKELIHTAALYHDIGFTVSRHGHENTSAQIAASILPRYGYTQHQINMVKGMILSTKLPQKPTNLLEQIIADADLDLLGRCDFMHRNHLLRNELAIEGHIYSDENWFRKQLMFLQNHRYFTKTAKQLREVKKQKNLLKVNQIFCMMNEKFSVEQVHQIHTELRQSTAL